MELARVQHDAARMSNIHTLHIYTYTEIVSFFIYKSFFCFRSRFYFLWLEVCHGGM